MTERGTVNQIPEPIEIHDRAFYLNLFDDIEAEWLQLKEFTEKAIHEPSLFFSDSYRLLQSPQNLLYRSIQLNGKKNKVGTIQEFQSFIGNQLNKVFQAWLKKQSIHINAQIKVTRENFFPSSYCLVVDGLKIYEFDIFQRKFMDKTETQTEDEILSYGKKEENRLLDELDHEKVELELAKKVRQSPLRHCGLKEVWLILFKRKEMNERLDEEIRKIEDRIQSIEDRIEKNQRSLPRIIDENKKVEESLVFMKPFFEQYEYDYQPSDS